jgi:hypothetical protein
MCLPDTVVCILKWCFGKDTGEMPTLLVDAHSLRMNALAPVVVSTAPVLPAPPVQPSPPVQPLTPVQPSLTPVQPSPPVDGVWPRKSSSLPIRRQAIAHLMRCLWAMARGRVFGYYSGVGCPLAARYLSEPESDGWGLLAMILSVAYNWMEYNSVDSLDGDTLSALTAIVSACLKFACDEDMRSITYMGVQIGTEVQILGVMSGHQLLQWVYDVHGHAAKLQAALDEEVISVVRHVPLCWHYVENAQARAERLLFTLYESAKEEEFDTHALYKAIRALPTFFYACIYDDLFIVQLPERHAPAMALAILASGEHIRMLRKHSHIEIAECREVLGAVLRSAAALPMPHVFATGGDSPHDEWATAERVQRAFTLLSQ